MPRLIEADPRKVFPRQLGKKRIRRIARIRNGIGNRPVDGQIRVSPIDATFIRRVMKVRYFVVYLRKFCRHTIAMSKPAWYEELTDGIRIQVYAIPVTVSG